MSYSSNSKVENTKVDEKLKLNFNNQDNIYYIILKRMIDLIGALLGILILSPIFLLVMVLIKIEDRNASVFFKQVRVGINGQEFLMYKFRSMITNAEAMMDELVKENEVEGLMFKIQKDPRITKVGSFIRKTSIDELPQLWNVIKGDMSLVGPRPPLPREVEKYNKNDIKRLSVIPGCTGLWQVSGRNELSFKEMVELDLYYIEKRSIGFDLKIIYRTIYVVLTSKGAY